MDQKSTCPGASFPMDAASSTFALAGSAPTKLFIGGISRRTTTKQLRDHFSQSGRVLDCVAMRTPDGRPRGFGYVTLDSVAAAEHFLSEPQIIDDRIVDMKRAVPEVSTPKGSDQLLLPFDYSMAEHSISMGMQAYCSPSSMFYPWAESGFYCDVGCNGNLLDMGMPSPPTLVDPLLDCVGLLTQSGSLLDGIDVPSDSGTAEEIQVPLGEITNTIGTSSQPPSTRNLTRLAEPESVKPYKPVSINHRVLGALGSPEQCFVFEDSPVKETSAASTAPPSPNDAEGDLSPQAPSIATPTELPTSPDADGDVADGLPSFGSAQHSAGECRRCNFFAKGRCRNGFDCIFCHLPHDRHKLSRQEKREQKAARQAQRSDAGSGTDDGSDVDSEGETSMMQQMGPLLLSPAAARAPPGLSAKSCLASEMPLQAKSTAASSSPDAALLPFMGPPGLSSPAAFTQLPSAGSAWHPAALNYYPWDVAGAGMLSTNPCSGSGAMSSALLSTSPTAIVAPTLPGPAKTMRKEMRTVETQTDADFACPWCEECGDGLWSCTPESKDCECFADKDAVAASSLPVSPSTRQRRPRPVTTIAAARGGA